MTANLIKQVALTHQRLTELLDYCSDTGIFYWKVSRRGHIRAGDQAGHIVKGYRQIKIGGSPYYEHRLAWFYVKHEWPTNQLDHINLNKADNRLSNLREATGSQNAFNMRCPTRNRVGIKGVSWSLIKRKWRATIAANGHHYHLGYFGSLEEAYATHKEAALCLHGKFANTERRRRPMALPHELTARSVFASAVSSKERCWK